MHSVPVSITHLAELTSRLQQKTQTALPATPDLSGGYFYDCFRDQRNAPPSTRNKAPNSASQGSGPAVVGRTSVTGSGGGGGGGGGATSSSSDSEATACSNSWISTLPWCLPQPRNRTKPSNNMIPMVRKPDSRKNRNLLRLPLLNLIYLLDNFVEWGKPVYYHFCCFAVFGHVSQINNDNPDISSKDHIDLLSYTVSHGIDCLYSRWILPANRFYDVWKYTT